jgi:hypothetical protein
VALFAILFVSTGNFTEDEKAVARERGVEILNRCNIAIYLDSEECKAWIEFLREDCVKFIDIWKHCVAFK